MSDPKIMVYGSSKDDANWIRTLSRRRGRTKALGVQPQLRRKAAYRKWVSAVNDYAGDMLREWDRWLETTARSVAKAGKKDRGKLIKAASERIVARMDKLARERLPDAYALGADRPLDQTRKGAALVTQFANRNEGFLRTSLKPAVEARLQKVVDEYFAGLGEGQAVTTADLLESTREALGTFSGRIASYAGPFWSLVNQGMGEHFEDAVSNATDRGLPKEEYPKVSWVLDPGADHCATCPTKVGTYSDLDELAQKCGGFPGEGQDDCGCNCRCYVDIE